MEEQQPMRLNKMNWVKPENWHITLYFLGDTPSEKVELLRQLIDQTFGEVSAFPAQLEGVGVFPTGAIRMYFGLD